MTFAVDELRRKLTQKEKPYQLKGVKTTLLPHLYIPLELIVFERHRQIETETDTDTDRQTETQTKTDRETERDRDRETERMNHIMKMKMTMIMLYHTRIKI